MITRELIRGLKEKLRNSSELNEEGTSKLRKQRTRNARRRRGHYGIPFDFIANIACSVFATASGDSCSRLIFASSIN